MLSVLSVFAILCGPESSTSACVIHASAGIPILLRSMRKAISREGVRSPESQRLTTPGLTPIAVARSSCDHSSFFSRARNCSAAGTRSAMGNLLRADNELSSVNATPGELGHVVSWQHGVVKTFREKLQEFLDAGDVKQAELAARVRVDPGAVSRWLSKGHLPSAQDFLAICRVFGVTDPWVLAGSSFVEPDPPRKVARPGRRPKDAALTEMLKVPRKTAASAPHKPPPPPRSTRRTRDESGPE